MVSHSSDVLVNPRPTNHAAQVEQLVNQETILRFHRDVLPGYAPTPLIEVKLDEGNGPRFKGRALLKCESDRHGLPAFKVLGAAFASYVMLCRLWSLDPVTSSLEQLQQCAQRLAAKPTLVAATDGNHGRAVAFFSALIGIYARIYIPSTVGKSSERAISSEGPGVNVLRLESDYDGAVKEAASYADSDPRNRILIQDTAWRGYTEVPQLIVEGYQTIFQEIDEQLKGEGKPSHIICPVGVGSLAQSMVQHYRQRQVAEGSRLPLMVSVEPNTAACLYESLRAGQLQRIQTSYTVMPGLNCGTTSSTAWPLLRDSISAAVKITDEEVLQRVAWLNKVCNVSSGPCGAAALTALIKLLTSEIDCATELGLLDDERVHVILLLTEGWAETS